MFTNPKIKAKKIYDRRCSLYYFKKYLPKWYEIKNSSLPIESQKAKLPAKCERISENNWESKWRKKLVKPKKKKKKNWIIDSEEETHGKFNQSNRFGLK